MAGGEVFHCCGGEVTLLVGSAPAWFSLLPQQNEGGETSTNPNRKGPRSVVSSVV